MKGLVFTLSRNKREKVRNFKRKRIDIKYFFKRYSTVAFFTLMLIIGLTVGSLMCNKIDSNTLARLDFFFTTNISDRLENGAVGAFCAGFASNFLFLLTTFLMGFSLWGAVLLPFIVAFKGFGIGISAGYLLINYGFKGVLFYLAVLLPGIFLFSMALIYQSAVSFNLFKNLYKSLFSRQEYNFRIPAGKCLQHSLKYLLISLFAAVLDMVLWCVFSGMFNFK